MAGNGTKQTLAEARARLEAALERNPDSIADAHERLVDVAKASRALLAALKAAEVGPVSPIDELVRNIAARKAEILNDFAEAYLAETGLKPSEVELCETRGPLGFSWKFRRREESPLPSDVGLLKWKLKQFRVWGTDECQTCETGRVTLFIANTQCMSCNPESYTVPKELTEPPCGVTLTTKSLSPTDAKDEGNDA
jgi:hypothetical protein